MKRIWVICLFISTVVFPLACGKNAVPLSPSTSTVSPQLIQPNPSPTQNTQYITPTATMTALSAKVPIESKSLPVSVFNLTPLPNYHPIRHHRHRQPNGDPCLDSGDADDTSGAVIVTSPFSGWGSPCGASNWVSDTPDALVTNVGQVLTWQRTFYINNQTDLTGGSFSISFAGDDAVTISVNGNVVGGCAAVCFPGCTSLSVPNSFLHLGANVLTVVNYDTVGGNIAVSYEFCGNFSLTPGTDTPTNTPTVPPTQTGTVTPPTDTPTGTLTDTDTPTGTITPLTITPTVTFTETNTPTTPPTNTQTDTPTDTDTFTPTFTTTISPTFTFTPTPNATACAGCEVDYKNEIDVARQNFQADLLIGANNCISVSDGCKVCLEICDGLDESLAAIKLGIDLLSAVYNHVHCRVINNCP